MRAENGWDVVRFGTERDWTLFNVRKALEDVAIDRVFIDRAAVPADTDLMSINRRSIDDIDGIGLVLLARSDDDDGMLERGVVYDADADRYAAVEARDGGDWIVCRTCVELGCIAITGAFYDADCEEEWLDWVRSDLVMCGDVGGLVALTPAQDGVEVEIGDTPMPGLEGETFHAEMVARDKSE